MARVLEAAEQMNYTPNLAARSLITRKTGTIGVVVSDITNPFYPELLEILHNEFALAGYRTVLFNERTDASPEQHIADLVNGAAADGVIYVSATLGSPLPGRPGGVPVVLVNRYLDDVDVDTVVSDNRRGGRLVAGASDSTRPSGASVSSATRAATSGASTSSHPSRGRPPCSPQTTSSRSGRSTRRGASGCGFPPSSRSSASTTSTWPAGKASA